MNWSKECAVLIPCLNEAATVPALIKDVQKLIPTVIVVDDGSSDDTGKLAAQAGASKARLHPQCFALSVLPSVFCPNPSTSLRQFP